MACLVAGQPTASQLLLQPVTPNSLNLWDSNEINPQAANRLQNSMYWDPLRRGGSQ
jgi:hypothetical protein